MAWCRIIRDFVEKMRYFPAGAANIAAVWILSPMRNRFRFAVVLALLAGNAQAADEVHYYSMINASATRIDYADENARLGKNGFETFSILTVLASGNVAYSLSEMSINCGSAQLATLSNVNYAANGALLPSEAVDPAPQPISAGTVGQALQAVACTGVDPYPRSKALKGLAAAVAKARELIAAQDKTAK
jgi:hypothetical protein